MRKNGIEQKGVAEKNINPSEFFEVITDFWGVLHDWTITFRALFDLAMFAEFTDNMDTRHELREIVSTLSAEW